jgi:hypothetical protein
MALEKQLKKDGIACLKWFCWGSLHRHFSCRLEMGIADPPADLELHANPSNLVNPVLADIKAVIPIIIANYVR